MAEEKCLDQAACAVRSPEGGVLAGPDNERLPQNDIMSLIGQLAGKVRAANPEM
jgi:hypothetical protein